MKLNKIMKFHSKNLWGTLDCNPFLTLLDPQGVTMFQQQDTLVQTV